MPIQDSFFKLDRGVAQVEFNKTIAGRYRDENAEYEAVGVLLLTWKDDDMGCKEKEVNQLEQVFKERFNFKTEQYEIPSEEPEDILFKRLQAFSRCYDSPSKLGIIYYGGHADKKETEDGIDLEFFARRSPHGEPNASILKTNTSLSDSSAADSPTDTKGGEYSHAVQERPWQSHISFKAFRERIKTAQSDIFLIVDSCFAAGAYTDQHFGGRRCELFCSIAAKDWARAPGHEGSFTNILTMTLIRMITASPGGFSTSELYSQIYRQQHQALKPYLFNQARFDFGKIWLRPCQKKEVTLAPAESESKYTIDVRFHLTKNLKISELNKVAEVLQFIPFVQMVNMQNMRSPKDDLREFIHTVHLANRLRPILARIRRKFELETARKLYRTGSSPPSPSADTSQRFHVHEPREVRLFDWSETGAITARPQSSTSDQHINSTKPSHTQSDGFRVLAEVEERPMADAALQMLRGHKESADKAAGPSGIILKPTEVTCLSQHTLDCLMCFGVGVLAPTFIGWMVRFVAA